MSLRLADLADRFYRFMEGHNAPGTIGYYRRHIDRFIAHVGEIDVDDLKRHHLKEWSKKWHPIQSVQRLFSWAHVDMEIIERNPFKGVKKPKSGGRKRVLTKRERAALLGKADANFRRVLFAMRESIARPQEIRKLRWEFIRWDGEHSGLIAAIVAGQAFFELWDYKSRTQRLDPDTPRVIYINGRFGRLLLWLAKKVKELHGPIFFNSRGKPWTANAVRLRMVRLRDRAGIGADGRGERIVCYTLRHTSATDATIGGMPDRVLAELMGHTSTRTTARYQHLSRQHVRDAVKRLENDNKNTNRKGE